MRWKKDILIALISFAVGLIVGWHPTFAGVRSFLIGGVGFGFIVQIIGILREWRKEHREEQSKQIESENEKRRLFGNLLSEIELNQERLEPIFRATEIFDDARFNIEYTDDDKIPEHLIFDNNIYSNSSVKFGLLNDEMRNKLIKYYNELKYMEEDFKKQKIHGYTYSFLIYLKTEDELPQTKISESKWPKIEEFLLHSKKVYDLGKKLIKELKE